LSLDAAIRCGPEFEKLMPATVGLRLQQRAKRLVPKSLHSSTISASEKGVTVTRSVAAGLHYPPPPATTSSCRAAASVGWAIRGA
jgi:hypothetical protein